MQSVGEEETTETQSVEEEEITEMQSVGEEEITDEDTAGTNLMALQGSRSAGTKTGTMGTGI